MNVVAYLAIYWRYLLFIQGKWKEWQKYKALKHYFCSEQRQWQEKRNTDNFCGGITRENVGCQYLGLWHLISLIMWLAMHCWCGRNISLAFDLQRKRTLCSYQIITVARISITFISASFLALRPALNSWYIETTHKRQYVCNKIDKAFDFGSSIRICWDGLGVFLFGLFDFAFKQTHFYFDLHSSTIRKSLSYTI